MSRHGAGIRRDPVLAAYLLFALLVTAWRPLWTIALRLVWLALLVAFKPRSAPPPEDLVEVPGR